MDPEYQQLHTEFVSNNNGTSPTEIILAGAPVHLSIFILLGLANFLRQDFTGYLGFVTEWILVCIPPLLSVTVLSEYAIALISVMILSGLTLMIMAGMRQQKTVEWTWDMKLSSEGGRAVYVTNYRASMLLITVICILAVDFPVFPRRFGKTETFGYGLMDLGVGGFVFSAGLVSPEARQISVSLKKNLTGCLPLIVLGFARLVSLAVTGYHSNVTEYGVHWNFFLSLASVTLFSSLILPWTGSARHTWVLSVGLAVLYEGFLTFGLVDWVLADGNRDDLISANREGLCSSVGYLALYIAGVAWGREILSSNTLSQLLSAIKLVCVWSVLMWMSLIYSNTFFLPPSRRLANYTFYTWTVAYNLTILLLFMVLDLLAVWAGYLGFSFGQDGSKSNRKYNKGRQKALKNPPKLVAPSGDESVVGSCYRCPTLYQAISFNSLPFFLFANLSTGIVNMTVSTLTAPTWQAVSILTLYLAGLSLVVRMLHRSQIRLKL